MSDFPLLILVFDFFFYKISYIAFVKINLKRARLDFGSDSNPRIRLFPGSDFLNMSMRKMLLCRAHLLRVLTSLCNT